MAVRERPTRQSILEEAAHLFRKQGYAATTIAQVADAIGISKGNLSYYFPSKQALYVGVHELAVSYVAEHLMLRSFAESPDALSGLEEFLRRLRPMLIDDEHRFVGCLFTNVTAETRHTDEAIARMGRDALEHFKGLAAAHIRQGQQRAELRCDPPADELTRMFFWMYEGTLTLARAMDDPAEFDAFRGTLRTWLSPAPGAG